MSSCKGSIVNKINKALFSLWSSCHGANPQVTTLGLFLGDPLGSSALY